MDDKPKKKVDLGAIAFAKVTKLEKRVKELEELINESLLKMQTPTTV